MRFDKDAIKDLLLVIVLPALLVIAVFWIAARYVQPAPPNAFVMTTGAAGGAISFSPSVTAISWLARRSRSL